MILDDGLMGDAFHPILQLSSRYELPGLDKSE